MMRTQETHKTATVIPFPDSAKRRSLRFEEEVRQIAENRFETVSDYEGGWYHNDAIRDADKNTKQ